MFAAMDLQSIAIENHLAHKQNELMNGIKYFVRNEVPFTSFQISLGQVVRCANGSTTHKDEQGKILNDYNRNYFINFEDEKIIFDTTYIKYITNSLLKR
ncbi:MAG: hypothetical protein RIQ33_954 [Bacteroidota bacterium]|jgi:hypothetical protein